jgi:sugar phosphate isomerase/epimerase
VFDRPERGGTWRLRWAPLEDRIVDFERLFEALWAAGYGGWLGIEDFSAVRLTRGALRHNLGGSSGISCGMYPLGLDEKEE